MKKILVIDDEEWLREMVHLALSQKGYEVIEAGNGSVGVEVARRDLPDLILCDVNMEKMDGYRTLSSMRSEPVTASIPFILMTGLADNAGMRHGMELGADDYLPKPFTIEALYAAVEARLKKATAIRQEAEKKLADLRDNISLMLPHEMRTPLNGILAFGQILANEAVTLPPEEVADMGRHSAKSWPTKPPRCRPKKSPTWAEPFTIQASGWNDPSRTFSSTPNWSSSEPIPKRSTPCASNGRILPLR